MKSVDISDDPAAMDALRYAGDRCGRMLSTPGHPICDKPLTHYLVRYPNIQCDRFILARCPDGHESYTPIIDD